MKQQEESDEKSRTVQCDMNRKLHRSENLDPLEDNGTVGAAKAE